MDDKTKQDIKKTSREIADDIAKLLRQEYKWYKDAWWLFSLGGPARELEPDEIEYAKKRGLIPRSK